MNATPFLGFCSNFPRKERIRCLLDREWLILAKANHNWKKNTLSTENEGKKYTINLQNQIVSQELASDSKSEGEYHEDGGIKPNEE